MLEAEAMIQIPIIRPGHPGHQCKSAWESFSDSRCTLVIEFGRSFRRLARSKMETKHCFALEIRSYSGEDPRCYERPVWEGD